MRFIVYFPERDLGTQRTQYSLVEYFPQLYFTELITHFLISFPCLCKNEGYDVPALILSFARII